MYESVLEWLDTGQTCMYESELEQPDTWQVCMSPCQNSPTLASILVHLYFELQVGQYLVKYFFDSLFLLLRLC